MCSDEIESNLSTLHCLIPMSKSGKEIILDLLVDPIITGKKRPRCYWEEDNDLITAIAKHPKGDIIGTCTSLYDVEMAFKDPEDYKKFLMTLSDPNMTPKFPCVQKVLEEMDRSPKDFEEMDSRSQKDFEEMDSKSQKVLQVIATTIREIVTTLGKADAGWENICSLECLKIITLLGEQVHSQDQNATIRKTFVLFEDMYFWLKDVLVGVEERSAHPLTMDFNVPDLTAVAATSQPAETAEQKTILQEQKTILQEQKNILCDVLRYWMMKHGLHPEEDGNRVTGQNIRTHVYTCINRIISSISTQQQQLDAHGAVFLCVLANVDTLGALFHLLLTGKNEVDHNMYGMYGSNNASSKDLWFPKIETLRAVTKLSTLGKGKKTDDDNPVDNMLQDLRSTVLEKINTWTLSKISPIFNLVVQRDLWALFSGKKIVIEGKTNVKELVFDKGVLSIRDSTYTAASFMDVLKKAPIAPAPAAPITPAAPMRQPTVLLGKIKEDSKFTTVQSRRPNRNRVR